MKPTNPLRSKWFRRTVQTLLGVASLIVLMVVFVNWWGARMKREVLADMKRAGRPLSLAEMLPPLPPDEENFAMIPILSQAREEWLNGPHPFARSAPPPGIAAGKLAAMLPVKIPANIRTDEPEGMQFWKDKLGLTGTDAECLAAYELQHQEVLGQLREGLARPHNFSPQAHRSVGKSERFGNRYNFPTVLVHGFSKALRFRAELAMPADRPEVACESYMILLRLAELLRSETPGMGDGYEWTVFARTMPGLSRALRSGRFTAEQILPLRAMLARVNVLDGTRRNLDEGNTQWFAMVEQQREHNGGKGLLHVTDKWGPKRRPQWVGTFYNDAENVISTRLPQGWFDLNGAIITKAGLELRSDLGESDDLAHWVKVYQKHKALGRARTNMGGWMQPAWSFIHFLPAGLEGGVRYQLLLRQAVVACDLEIHRQKHGGRYPADLAEISPPATDPLTGELFRYRLEGDGGSYALWSVGFDGKDDGGNVSERGTWRAKDSVWW